MERTIPIATFGIALASCFFWVPFPAHRLKITIVQTPALMAASHSTGTGTTFNPSASLFAQAGRQTFDGNGNTGATAMTSINGASFPVTIKGTYAVNRDCTGSLTLHASPVDITVHADFVIASDGAGFQAIVTDPGSSVTYVVKKQFHHGE